MAENEKRRMAIGPSGRYFLLRDLSLRVVDGFGTTVSAIDRDTKERVAIKVLSKHARGGDCEGREFVSRNALRHPHILGCKEVFEVDDHLCAVMEHCGGGTLHNRVKSNECIKEPLARWYFQQIILAVDFAHRMNTTLGDIKLENILLNETGHMVKLCSFKFRQGSCDGHEKCLGTLEHIAPEILAHCDPPNEMSVDVWACGVCLYQMLYGTAADPVGINTNRSLASFRKVVSKVAGIPTHQFGFRQEPTRISEECRNLLKQLLEKDPKGRATLADIISSPWFQTDLPDGALQYNDELIASMENNTKT